jgi:hypothetical protein
VLPSAEPRGATRRPLRQGTVGHKTVSPYSLRLGSLVNRISAVVCFRAVVLPLHRCALTPRLCCAAGVGPQLGADARAAVPVPRAGGATAPSRPWSPDSDHGQCRAP